MTFETLSTHDAEQANTYVRYEMVLYYNKGDDDYRLPYDCLGKGCMAKSSGTQPN